MCIHICVYKHRHIHNIYVCVISGHFPAFHSCFHPPERTARPKSRTANWRQPLGPMGRMGIEKPGVLRGVSKDIRGEGTRHVCQVLLDILAFNQPNRSANSWYKPSRLVDTSSLVSNFSPFLTSRTWDFFCTERWMAYILTLNYPGSWWILRFNQSQTAIKICMHLSSERRFVIIATLCRRSPNCVCSKIRCLEISCLRNILLPLAVVIIWGKCHIMHTALSIYIYIYIIILYIYF